MNHPLRGIEVETLTSEWLKGPTLRPRSGLPGIARRTDDGALTRSDSIELLATRYPVIRRLVGASSFLVTARRLMNGSGKCASFCIHNTARSEVVAEGRRIAYDYLVVATGAEHTYFGHDWSSYAPGSNVGRQRSPQHV